MLKRKRGGESGEGIAQAPGGEFDAKRRHWDRHIGAEPIYSIDQKPCSALLLIDNQKRETGSQYNWRQNLGPVMNGGRLELEELYVTHSWNTINSHNFNIRYKEDGVTYTADLTEGQYSITDLVTLINADFSAKGIGTTLTASTTGPGVDIIDITVPAGSEFEFLQCTFIAFAPFVHGFSQYDISSRTWVPYSKIDNTGGASPLTVHYSPAYMVSSRFYSVRSQNMTQSHKLRCYGTGVSEDTLAIFTVSKDKLGTTENTLYNIDHSILLSNQANIGSNIDVQVVDEFGNIAESNDVTASVMLQFSFSLHY